jgi:hypothetical protein
MVCSLFVVRCSFFVVRCSFFVVRCSMLIVASYELVVRHCEALPVPTHRESNLTEIIQYVLFAIAQFLILISRLPIAYCPLLIAYSIRSLSEVRKLSNEALPIANCSLLIDFC